ncbi:MAG: DUF3592 domain-containing protein [Pseudomonadota bacterium]
MSSSTSHRLLGIFGCLLLVPSGLVALGALWLLASSLSLGRDTRTVAGRVVAHEASRLKLGTGQKSVVEFSAHDGRALRVTDPLVRQGAAVHKVGESVKVRYPMGDPLQAQIIGSVFVQGFIGGVLLLFSAVGVLLGWLLLRLRPRSPAAATT